MRKRTDYGEATPEDVARARPDAAYERAPDASPFGAIRSRYSRRFPTSPAVRTAICAYVSAFRTLCFPANSLT